MNVSRLSVIVLSLVAFFGCTEDPLEDFQSDDRQVLSFSVPGQIGSALIKPGNNNTGVVEIFVVFEENELSSVAPELVVSAGASVTPAVGETVNLVGETNVNYIVTSASGLTRTWEIRVTPYESSIEGEWVVNGSVLYDWHIGLNQPWGWGVFGIFDVETGSYDPDQYAPEQLMTHLPDAALENDNTIIFRTIQINENGNPEGSFTFSPGPDGQFAPFIVNPDRFAQSTNYAYRFRRIPEGDGVWEFNEAGNVLTLWKGNKSGTNHNGIVSTNPDGSIRIAFDPRVPEGVVDPNEYDFNHFGVESHIQNALAMYYDFSPINN